jgi:AcrR family transcriptional regulator
MTAVSAHPDDIAQEEILRAALLLYQKFGPNKVTMDDVANASGRSRTSLYYYYKNRDEIFLAVLDTIVNDIAKEIRQAVANVGSLEDKIYAFCITKLKTSEDWKSILTVIVKSMETLHKKLIHAESVILNEILTEADRRKEMRELPPGEQDMLVFLISTSIRGLRREILELNDPHDLKAALRLQTDILVKWLRK